MKKERPRIGQHQYGMPVRHIRATILAPNAHLIDPKVRSNMAAADNENTAIPCPVGVCDGV